MPTDPSVTPSSVLDALEDLGRCLHSAGFSDGLNPAQWAALRFIARRDGPPRTVAGFARHHRATTGTASQTIDALVRKGLVRRVDNPNDRRSALLTITDAGRALLERAPLMALERHVAGLSTREQTSLHTHVAAMTAVVEAVSRARA